jgi:hypothetical protein
MIRKMGNFDISQRTKDSMFSATELLSQWNKSIGASGRKGKRVDDFLNLESTKQFLEVLNEEIINTDDSRYLKTHISERGKNGGTWMHPFLFIDFAMWINPKFKLSVIKFVYDQLIKQRNDAGDNYISLSASGVKLKGYDFREVAIAMQWIVFNKRGKNLRQTANEQQLQELNKLQSDLSFLIDNSYITSYNQLLEDMRKMYNKKYTKF